MKPCMRRLGANSRISVPLYGGNVVRKTVRNTERRLSVSTRTLMTPSARKEPAERPWPCQQLRFKALDPKAEGMVSRSPFMCAQVHIGV